MKVGSKKVVEDLFPIVCMGLGMDCLHIDSISNDGDNPTARTC